MYPILQESIRHILTLEISDERKTVLQPLIDYIRKKVDLHADVNLNFICTHNSRRSHLSQIWAQAAAAYFNVPKVYCYSGGTEETALFPKIAETLSMQGFHVLKIADGENPIYSIKYAENAMPVIGFSKKFDDAFNPVSSFAAIMTCSQADEGCPFIAGAEQRIALTFEDPKVSDNTVHQTKVYSERSLQIASELFYVFSGINR